MTAGCHRLRALAAEMVAAGFTTRLHHTHAGLDLNAMLGEPGIEVIIGADGYTELRFWSNPHTAPGDVAAAITLAAAAIGVITAATNQSPVEHPQRPPARPVAGYDGPVTDCAGDRAMPGPPDHVVAPRGPNEVPPEHLGDNDANAPGRTDIPGETRSGRETDLDGRLQRLRPNHPSYPFRDDGSRKPPPPDLAEHELPLLSEQDSPAEPASERSPGSDHEPDQHLPAPDVEDKARIGPDGSWESKGLQLSAEQSRIADQVLQRCRQVEGRDAYDKYGPEGLTPAMRHIESKLEHGQLVEDTEIHALKSPDRFKEKLGKLIGRHPGEKPEQLAASIHDGIRYTFAFDTERYTKGVGDATRMIQESGFKLFVRKNTWSDGEYKGINTRWRDPASNLLFEVQFHTRESWNVKQHTHQAYEKINDPTTPPAEVESLRGYQRRASEKIPIPSGSHEVTDYRKETR